MVYKFHLPTTRASTQKLKQLRGSLISVAGLKGRQVVNQDGQVLGSIVDLVCHWDAKETYPPLTGVIMKVASRKVWISASNLRSISPTAIQLNDATLDLRDFKSRPGEVCLNQEVLDHQLIDINGARVVRASDLYIATLSGRFRLVGVDVGLRPILWRLGPKSLRAKALPDSVIDWATIQSFGGQETTKRQLKLSANRHELRRMRPGELADLLEDLGRQERQDLLSVLSADQAADALEEMEPKELEAILRESSPAVGSRFLSKMEPDEAADALRDVDPRLREELMALMPADHAKMVSEVLSYDEATAGGIMNTDLLVASKNETVGQLQARLKELETDINSLNAVAIVNDKGKLEYDLALVDLLTAEAEQKLAELMKPPATITVLPDASLKDVAEKLVESRGSSIVVTDKKEHPLGRILADDLLDVLLPSGRFHFPRLLS